MFFVMRIFLRSERGLSRITDRADVPSERPGGVSGYGIRDLTPNNTGEDLLEAMNRKINELKRDGLIEQGYEIDNIDSPEGIGADNILPMLVSDTTLDRCFRNTSIWSDRRIYVDVYLERTTDAQVRNGRKGGKSRKRRKSKKRRRTRKRL